MHIYLCARDKYTDGESMLRECLSHYAKENSIDLSEEQVRSTPIKKEAHGKPFFAEIPGVFFSVSHSSDLWGCAFSDLPVGFDLENTERGRRKNLREKQEDRFLAIAKRYFSSEEYIYTTENGSNAFFCVWVRKEAFVKYLGTGIASGLNTFSVVANGELSAKIGSSNCQSIDLCAAGFSGMEAALCFKGTADRECKIYLFDQKYGCVRKNK